MLIYLVKSTVFYFPRRLVIERVNAASTWNARRPFSEKENSLFVPRWNMFAFGFHVGL